MAPPTPRKERPRPRGRGTARGGSEPGVRALGALCDLAADIAGTAAAAVYLHEGRKWRLVAGTGERRLLAQAQLSLPSIPSDAPIVLTDAAKELGLFAGLPITSEAGLRGALCVVDETPRRLTQATLGRLQQISGAAADILALRARSATLTKGLTAPHTVATGYARGLKTEIRRAIGNGEFVPFYQPKVELKWGRIVGFEVLARWRHPTRGLLAPEAFQPATSDRAIAPLLTRAMLKPALKDCASWRVAGLKPGTLAVNVTLPDLMDEAFAGELLQTLEMHGFDPADFIVEVTEGIAMGAPEGQVHKTLATLRVAGISVMLDDFGTGFAGLQHLRRWPIDGVKIDRGFVRHCLTDSHDQVIIRGIVQMCRDLGLEVVAEGIEENAQSLFLASVGCTFGQGFYFAKPLPADEVPQLLRGDGQRASDRPSGRKPKAVRI